MNNEFEKNLLSKNGEILIAVPNEEIIKFNELNGALLDMPPNHIGRWSKKTFFKYFLKSLSSLKSYENIQ